MPGDFDLHAAAATFVDARGQAEERAAIQEEPRRAEDTGPRVAMLPILPPSRDRESASERLTVSWDEYMAESYERVPSLWGDRRTPLLVKGGGYLIASGDTGVGKTILFANLMLAMADARYEFLSFPLPGRPVCQLFLEAEGSRELFRDRVREIAGRLGIRGSPPIFFRRRADELSIERLGNMIADCKAEHVFLDPVGRFHDADENSTPEWRRHVSNPLAKLAANLDVAISFSDHYSKPNENRSGQHKVRGAAAKIQDCGAAMRLEVGAAGKGSRILFFDRVRDGALPFSDRDPSRMPLLIDLAAGTIQLDEAKDADLGTTSDVRVADVAMLAKKLSANSPLGKVSTTILRLSIESNLVLRKSQAEALITSAKRAGTIESAGRGYYQVPGAPPTPLPLEEQ